METRQSKNSTTLDGKPPALRVRASRQQDITEKKHQNAANQPVTDIQQS